MSENTKGLEGVVAADSAIGKIDGQVGELRYRGYLIKDLADYSDFVETSYLLVEGKLPTKSELEGFRKKLLDAQSLSEPIQAMCKQLATQMAPMDFVRTIVSALCVDDRPNDDDDRQKNIERGVSLIAKLPTIVANYARLRRGEAPIAPHPDLGFAATFLHMLTGKVPDEAEARMFDVCLILHAEHGFNASTFSARVTAATLSDMYSAITSAIGTLKGPLHGGANTAVMNMLLKIGEPKKAEAFLDDLIERKQKVMGFGHRVYKVVDPRALILKEFSRKLAEHKNEPKWFEMSEILEKAMKAKKGIDMNVDFYSASTYYYMGIEPDLFTCIFAMSRMAGWVAHVLEQQANNRLIRPRSNWVGPGALDWVPIEKR
jgi:citrate synthase